MVRGYETRVRLIITNNRGPKHDFTTLISVLQLGTPERVWHEGDALDRRSGRTRPNNGIAFMLYRGFDGDPVLQAQRSLQHLMSLSEETRIALQANDVELAFTVRLNGGVQDKPPFHFSKEFIALISELNVEIDLDLYNFSTKYHD